MRSRPKYGSRQIDRIPSGVRIHTTPASNSKQVSRREQIYSVRVGIGYRALGLREGDHVYWFWIGSHSQYDDFLKRL